MEEKWSIDRLTASNYTTWKFKFKHFLIARELYGYVDGSVTQPTEEPAKANYTKKLNKALSLIVLAVSDELLYLITECDSPKAAWEALSKHFERDTLANKMFLKKRYFRSVMSESSTIEQHLKFMKDLTDRLAAIRAPISEEDQVVTLLGSLPDSYSTVVTALETQQDPPTLEFVQQALLNEEQKRREQVLPASVGVSGARSNNANPPDTAMKAGRPKPKCWDCGKVGHMQRQCPNRKQHSNSNNHNRSQHKAKHVADDTESAFAINNDDGENSTSQRWLIDSGATKHMTPYRSLFTDYQEFEKPEKVAIADGKTVNALGVGRVMVSVSANRSVARKSTLYDVLYVPDLSSNLFSVRAVTSRNMTVQFGHSRCWVRNKCNQLCARGTLVDKLYYLDLESSDHANAAVAKSDSLWHSRLAHVHEAAIKRMCREGLVNGAELSETKVGLCEPCVKGKMSRMPFKARSEIKSTRVLELVHTDVCGPMRTTSLGGSRYFVTFVDDFTRYTHVYFLHDKSEVFSKFLEFSALVSNQTGQSIGTLRSDGGGEYISNEFETHLKSCGIRHEITVRYSAEQNGVAERYNRTVCEAARAMIIESRLPKFLWAEAIATAAYVRNRVPTRAHSEPTTPYELWHGSKPDISNLRVFGCLAYSHIPDQLRGKLDDKAESMLHVGYSTRSKGYRLYDIKTKSVVVRRDVVFDEAVCGVTSDESCHVPVVRPSPCADNSSSKLIVDLDTADDSHPLRRSERQRREPDRYQAASTADHVACHASEIIEPQTIDQVENSPQRSEWIAAAEREYEALMNNETWSLVELPPGRKSVGCKWVFKAKYTPDGNVDRYKARLVAKGYAQKAGVDYDETYSPVVSFPSLRAVLAEAVDRGMHIHQMDVVTAFLNGSLDEDIYMDQPSGFVQPGDENLVCKLSKSLYGLKQSPRCWNIVLDNFLKSLNFVNSNADQCVYVRELSGSKAMIAVYVDDLVIMTDTEDQMLDIKQALAAQYNMKDLGPLHFCLGISVEQEQSSITLNQKHYVNQILHKFGMNNANPVSTPMATDVKFEKEDGSKPADQSTYQSIIGSLLYAASATRPDISHAVGVLSRFNSSPTETHMSGAKRVLRYLKGTSDRGIKMVKSDGKLVAYSDSSWADNSDNRTSTSGSVFMHGSAPIYWSSKSQSVVAVSTAEAEYIALYDVAKQAAWLKQLYNDIRSLDNPAILTHVDNQSAISIAQNNTSSKRTRHMDIKYHYCREAIEKGIIQTTFCPSESNVADMFTKPLARPLFGKMLAMLNEWE